MLVATGTTINVESLMGTIMAVGVGVSNGNLLITFANEQREEGGERSVGAAIQAGHIRFRPIIMTALAMILGMLPMALGLGKGGEQNAPLGRAVIGGLFFATAMTLFVVPTIYSIFSRNTLESMSATRRSTQPRLNPLQENRMESIPPKEEHHRESASCSASSGWLGAMIAVMAGSAAVVMARTHSVSMERSKLRTVAASGPHVLVTRPQPHLPSAD